MKSVFFCIVLISLCSCGGSSKPEAQAQAQSNQIGIHKEELFDLPKLNVHRSVTIEEEISSLYEDMTVKSRREENILGDEAFYIMINENVFPSYYEIELNFYNQTKVNNVFYIDVKNLPLSLLEVSKEHLASLKMKESTNYLKDGLVWGKRNLDNPESDMQNKAFVIRTEEMHSTGSMEYTSHSTYLIWFECLGNVKAVKDIAYSCSKYNLKFHYKLLDYSMTSTKI